MESKNAALIETEHRVVVTETQGDGDGKSPVNGYNVRWEKGLVSYAQQGEYSYNIALYMFKKQGERILNVLIIKK